MVLVSNIQDVCQIPFGLLCVASVRGHSIAEMQDRTDFVQAICVALAVIVILESQSDRLHESFNRVESFLLTWLEARTGMKFVTTEGVQSVMRVALRLKAGTHSSWRVISLRKHVSKV